MLELATFSPHGPFTPAPRHANLFPNLRAPRGPLFNAKQRLNPPSWLPTAPLTNAQIAQIDANFRMRAQSVQAIDEMIGAIRAQLRRLGAADNTYIVFSSDNGYHMGQRRLLAGKQTYFDHDVRVPMVVVGPGVPPRRLGHARGRERRSAPDLPGARRDRRSSRASRAAAWRGFLRGLAAGDVARCDADRAPRAEPPAGRSGRAAGARQPADLRGAAVRRRALRAVRRIRRTRRSTTTSYATRSSGATSTRRCRTSARPRWPRSSRRCGRAAAAPPVTRPTPGRRVSPHAGDPDRRAQRP